MNGQDFLKVVQEAYAETNESNPCLSAVTFHAKLKGSYNGDLSLKFPTPGMLALSQTFGRIAPIKGDRYFPHGRVPLRTERSLNIPLSQSSYSTVRRNDHSSHTYQIEGPPPAYGKLQCHELRAKLVITPVMYFQILRRRLLIQSFQRAVPMSTLLVL